MNFSRFLGLFLFVDKFSAANECIGFRFCRGFFVFRFDKVSGQRGDLILAQLCIVPNLAWFMRDRRRWCFRLATGCFGVSFGLRACVSQKPAGKPAGKAAGDSVTT